MLFKFLIVAALLLLALVALLPPWRRRARLKVGQPVPRARKPRGPLLRDTCPYCGEVGIVVRRTDGEPNCRFHRCHQSAGDILNALERRTWEGVAAHPPKSLTDDGDPA